VVLQDQTASKIKLELMKTETKLALITCVMVMETARVPRLIRLPCRLAAVCLLQDWEKIHRRCRSRRLIQASSLNSKPLNLIHAGEQTLLLDPVHRRMDLV
jgi:hypothetical protein